MSENMSLLSQNEVDTLINFVKENQGAEINGTTLTQDSVDKLITLLENAKKVSSDTPKFNKSAVSTGASSFIAAKQDIDADKYELTYKCDTKGQVMLYACNVDTNSTISISPQFVVDNPNLTAPSTWGVCIIPVAFDRIAKELGMNYSDATMDSVKKLFAEKMYGDPNIAIPNIYLPKQ